MIQLQTVEPFLISAANWTWLQLGAAAGPQSYKALEHAVRASL
jgi:hypothetical protein